MAHTLEGKRLDLLFPIRPTTTKTRATHGTSRDTKPDERLTIIINPTDTSTRAMPHYGRVNLNNETSTKITRQPNSKIDGDITLS